MGLKFNYAYKHIISRDNLLLAWKEFLKGKRNKKDVEDFRLNLMEHILSLHEDLSSKSYRHAGYYAFNINDPKPRNIHKASVRDRLLHHAIYRKLYPFFDKIFVFDSYSCRKLKGTHRAIERFKAFIYEASKNNTKTLWVLKCDVRKFFASIDHEILFRIVSKYIPDQDINWLIGQVVRSFSSTAPGKGLPLGNLTSQLLVNVYMNEFDRFVKQTLRVKYYIRYADDFVLLHHDKKLLLSLLTEMEKFLLEKLKLSLHPNKVTIKTIASGVDFLGWIHFFDHRVLRTATNKRMLSALKDDPTDASIISYKGMISHGNTHKLKIHSGLDNFLLRPIP